MLHQIQIIQRIKQIKIKNLLIKKNNFPLGIDKKKDINNIVNLCTGFIDNKLI